MRVMLFAKEIYESEKSTFPPAWRTGGVGAMVRLAARLTACAFLASLPVTSAAVASPVELNSGPGPIDANLMDRTEEIAVVPRAAPNSISDNAAIMIVIRTGYETATMGPIGLSCWVGRGFGAAVTMDRMEMTLLTHEIPPLGAMSSVISKFSDLPDEGEHNMPHVMFFGVINDADWVGNLPDITVMSDLSLR